MWNNVDLVFGMDWLAQWNPVIDWRRQVIHVYVDRHWMQVYGTLLDETQQVGVVKVLDPYSVLDEKRIPERVSPKAPKLWTIERSTVEWKEMNVQKGKSENVVICMDQQMN